jgi:hypothetical protein
MSVGYNTYLVGLSFNGCRTGGLFRPEEEYSTNDGHAGDSGQKRHSASEA